MREKKKPDEGKRKQCMHVLKEQFLITHVKGNMEIIEKGLGDSSVGKEHAMYT